MPELVEELFTLAHQDPRAYLRYKRLPVACRYFYQEFEAICRHQCITDDPTVYVHVSAKENPTDAPASQENWFVMINVPADQGQNWGELIVQARANILGKLSWMLATAIEPPIVSERTWAPAA